MRRTALRIGCYSFGKSTAKGGADMFPEQFALSLSLLLKLFTLWFLFTALLFWRRPAPYPRREPALRFACLIPARNEEAVIAALVQSLREQRYPPDLFEIIVIPNNCTDGTEAAALAAGARVFRCKGTVRYKGDALREAVAALLPEGFDAFCLFDADNLVHPDFLRAMNDAMLAGARVTKGRLRVRNPRDSWVAGCYALYFTLNDTLFSRSRANLGLSAKLVGTGMAVHREVLEELGGWNTGTMAEDAEFSAQCAVLGRRVYWVPEAVTWDEAPRSFRVSLTQRRRWCSGVMSVAERMLPRLLSAPAGASRARILDMCFFLCAPFAQAISPLSPLLLALCAAVRGELGGWGLRALTALPAALVGMLLLSLALGLGGRERLRPGSLLLFPLFMASFLPLQVLSLLRRTTEWKAIRHGEGLLPAPGPLSRG